MAKGVSKWRRSIASQSSERALRRSRVRAFTLALFSSSCCATGSSECMHALRGVQRRKRRSELSLKQREGQTQSAKKHTHMCSGVTPWSVTASTCAPASMRVAMRRPTSLPSVSCAEPEARPDAATCSAV